MKKRFKRSGFLITLITVLVLFVLISYQKIGLESKLNSLKEQQVKYEEREKELVAEKESIQEYKKYKNSDEYIEDEARNKLGLVYPGDIVFEPEEE